MKDTLIIIAITISLLVGIEIVLRIQFPERVIDYKYLISPQLKPDLAFEHNNDYQIALKPNQHKVFQRSAENGKQIINWQTNTQGFRGRELQDNPELRVMVYGDSNIQARFSSLENTFPYHLQALISSDREQSNGIEVVNAGLIGSGPDQNLIRLGKDLDTYKPDLVIFHVFTDNDYGDLVRNRLFELDDKNQLKPTNFATAPDKHLYQHSSYLHDGLFLTLLNSTLTMRQINQAIREPGKTLTGELSEQSTTNLLAKNLAEFEIYKTNKRKTFSHFDDAYDFDIAIAPNSESANVKAALLAAVFLELKQIETKYQVPILIVIQPSRNDMVDIEGSFHDALNAFEAYDPRRLTDVANKACSRVGLNCLNLYDTFLSHTPSELFFLGRNNHWNDKGQELAAKRTYAHIKKAGLLPALL